ncbi:uncharacterized protein P7C73_g4328, partial [Tremellales sp. Uapishka_1]
MPLFLCYCPDRPDHLAQRLAVRAEHLKRGELDNQAGIVKYGKPFLPPPDAKPHGLPEGTPNIGGSFMIYEFPSLEACWARLKEDVYWTADVWNKEKMAVEELMP